MNGQPSNYAKYHRAVLQLERVVRDLQATDSVLLADTIDGLVELISYNQELVEDELYLKEVHK
jgi:hypothetical protein